MSDPIQDKRGGLVGLLEDPQSGHLAQWLLLGLLSGIALLLRCQLDLTGVRDVDALNFGLAAWDFNPVEQRPHPPGYAGYVFYLKGLHLLVPQLAPDALAKWGSRLLGTLCVPAAWWTCRVLLDAKKATADTPRPSVRPLLAAALVLLQPLLWYYSADGQSHAAEAFATLLLFGVAVRARRDGRLRSAIALALLFAIAASLRPTIALLCSPLLVWVYWNRPLKDWAGGVLAGIAGTSVWYLPTLAASGGYERFTRASDALVNSLFIQNFSVFGSQTSSVFVSVNLNIALWGLGLALVLFPSWQRSPSCEGDVRWGRAALALILLNAAFYLLVYSAETGYFIAIAALSVLAPATWPASQTLLQVRSLLALVSSLLGGVFVLFGPAEAPLLGTGGATLSLPTFQSMVRWDGVAVSHLDTVCPTKETRHRVLLTDSPYSELQRQAALSCNLSVVRWLTPSDLQPEADGLLIYRGPRLFALPTGIPFEPGPASLYTFPEAVHSILLSPLASPGAESALRAQEVCPPEARHPDSPTLRWSPECLPELKLGSQQLRWEVP